MMFATDSNSRKVFFYDDVLSDPVGAYSSGPGSAAAFSLSVSTPSDASADPYNAEFPSDIVTYDPVPAASSAPTDYVNVLRFDCIIRGESVVLLFSPSYVDSLFIDGENRLWNMSTSNIQGRVMGEVFDLYQTEGDLIYLTPCLGNNFNSIYQNGSPNYLRRYRRSGSRLDYTDVYVEIEVTDYHYPFFVSNSFNYLFLFLLMGGVLLIWLRNFKHY